VTEMKRLFLIITGFVFVINLTVLADEPYTHDKITKIERVRWSGLSVGSWRIFGSWAIAPKEVSLFGTASPYFRLNGNDKTVFRGLGRESNLAQHILPTLHSRSQLREIISADDMASQSLMKFDNQVATGEKINAVSTAGVFTGKTAIVAGVVMMFASLGGETEIGETPPMLKAGYAVASAGISLWLVGKIGQLAGNVVTEQSFSHLDDAMRYYNNKSKQQSRCLPKKQAVGGSETIPIVIP